MEKRMNIRLIYVTTPDRQTAEQIAEAVVTEKLAACANILDGVTSIFYWDGKLCRENEAVLILKTPKERVEELTERIKKLHPYDCPCVVALPIDSGNPDFFQWVGSIA
jgi:periplasmic divalent cation tolerance protein